MIHTLTHSNIVHGSWSTLWELYLSDRATQPILYSYDRIEQDQSRGRQMKEIDKKPAVAILRILRILINLILIENENERVSLLSFVLIRTNFSHFSSFIHSVSPTHSDFRYHVKKLKFDSDIYQQST